MIAWYWIPITVVVCTVITSYALAWYLSKAFRR